MKFDLENTGVWFYFDDDNPSEGVCIKRITAEKFREIKKKTTSPKVEYRRGQRFEYMQSDDDMENRLMWDSAIVDWKGIEDQNGNPIPCNTEMKYALMGKSMRFASFVTECLEKLNQEDTLTGETSEKN